MKEGSNAQKAGIAKGDVLRAVTAQKVQPPAMGMAQEQVQVRKAIFICDGNGFGSTMSALGTNSESAGGVCCVLLWRNVNLGQVPTHPVWCSRPKPSLTPQRSHLLLHNTP